MPNREHETSLEEGLSERSKLIPLFLGPILALCLYFVLPTSYVGTEGDVVQFSDAARACTAMVLWMGIWWFTEPVPIAVTALLPIVMYPILGIATPADTLKNYANGTIFLFLGGFLIAAGIARWGLDRRIALVMIRIVGTKPKHAGNDAGVGLGEQYGYCSHDASDRSGIDGRGALRSIRSADGSG